VDWHIPLLVSAIAFAAFMVFRFRPVISGDGRASAALLKGAKQRILAAKDDVARASALCDAADACARLGRIGSAVNFYLRALRADPTSKEVAHRAAEGLARRPAALEKVMWRQLASTRFGESREAAVIALRALSRRTRSARASMRARARSRTCSKVWASSPRRVHRAARLLLRRDYCRSRFSKVCD
jgi:hypothetical protein